MHDLVIATSTYFGTYRHVEEPEYRKRLWGWFLDSLLETDFAGRRVILAVADDGSRESPIDRPLPFDYILFHRNANIGYNGNIIGNLNLVAGLAPFCLTVDSDAYFHPDWLKWTFQTMDRFGEAAGWGLFNSPRHTNVKTREREFITKDATCLHGLVYRTTDRKPVPVSDYVEHFIYDIQKKRGDFVFPRISMIQHTGCYGFNNKPLCSQDYDPLFPLNDKCGLAGYTDRAGFEEVQF